MRVKITLACTECKQRNYDTYKNKKNDDADSVEKEMKEEQQDELSQQAAMLGVGSSASASQSIIDEGNE